MSELVNDRVYDGNFECDGETIYYNIVSDDKPIRKIRGEEKMSGYFAYFKKNGEPCGVSHFYEDYENMTPMDSSVTERYYRKLNQ